MDWKISVCVYCLVLVCARVNGSGRECRQSSLGFGYTGTASQTVSGRTCQAWSSQSPQTHPYTDDRFFPDDTVADAANYCRNPSTGDAVGLWCYTTDPGTRWERCDVPACSEFPECRLTESGQEYRGHVSRTASGQECVPWNVEELAEELEGNFCRNPDNKPGGPWCGTSETDAAAWEYCDIPYCKPSAPCKRTALGSEYVGTVSATVNGLPCQRWDSQFPHAHEFNDPASFPDATVADANNFCRNPNGDPGGLWCYTKNPDVEWEYCDVQICEDCKISTNGVEYSGTVAVTRTGASCFDWNRLSSHAASILDSDRFPDASIDDATNFCRNPDRKSGGPWCFTGDSESQWDYCDVQQCTGTRSNTFKPRISNHVLHIGIDGLHPCFVNCSTGAPNIMQRIAQQGVYTLSRGRTVLQTVSAPSWSATTCGMNVESTGITDNTWKSPWLGNNADITPTVGGVLPIPCAWQAIKFQDRNIRTATFTDWDWWWYITSMGIPDAIDHDYFCEPTLTEGGEQQCDSYSTGNATEYLRQLFQSADASYTFVYVAHTDTTGHTFGYCGQRYLNMIDFADGLVGQLLDVIDEAGLTDEVTVLLSTDHGGHNFSHGSWQDSDIVIPLFVRGPGFRKNEEFRHEVRNWDLAPTALEVLGVKQSPWWKGKVLSEAFV